MDNKVELLAMLRIVEYMARVEFCEYCVVASLAQEGIAMQISARFTRYE